MAQPTDCVLSANHFWFSIQFHLNAPVSNILQVKECLQFSVQTSSITSGCSTANICATVLSPIGSSWLFILFQICSSNCLGSNSIWNWLRFGGSSPSFCDRMSVRSFSFPGWYQIRKLNSLMNSDQHACWAFRVHFVMKCLSAQWSVRISNGPSVCRPASSACHSLRHQTIVRSSLLWIS